MSEIDQIKQRRLIRGWRVLQRRASLSDGSGSGTNWDTCDITWVHDVQRWTVDAIKV